MKKVLLMIVLASIALSSSAKKRLAITVAGENLLSLAQITDNEYPCVNPYGGDKDTPLFFSVCEKKKYYNIFKKDNPLSSSMTQKTSGDNYNIQPCYNAATDRLAFSCQQDGSSTSDIFAMYDKKGTALYQITESNDAFEGSPSYNKDGTMLTFHKISRSYYTSLTWFFFFFTTTTMVEHSEIWIKNIQTGENVLLTGGYQPSFSPDGKKITFVKYSSDNKSCGIWTMNIDGTEQMQVYSAKKGYAYCPRFSPDGKKIVFQASKKDKKDSDLYIVNADGGSLIQLTTNKSEDGNPYWSDEGYIYFSSDRGNEAGNYQIWRFKYE